MGQNNPSYVILFRDFCHSNQTKVFKCSNVLFIFFEENTEKYLLIKELCIEQKMCLTSKKSHEISLC
jgi:hypothetical protein